MAQILDLSFKRIQFTPDLMPADITGTEVLDEEGGRRTLRFVPGPIFANIILADEINRTPPKTQAALLEAMQEYHVTAAGRTYPLERPFFVLATQNPIELEGTYPLPEAQLDRFMFNIVMTYLPEDEEVRVVTRTTGAATETPSRVLTGAAILEIQQLVRQVAVAEEIARYAVRLVDSSRPGRQADLALRAGVGQVGRRAARLAGADSRRQGARAAARALPRGDRRHPGAGAAGAAPPHHPEFLRRVRAGHRRSHRRTAARGGAAAAAAACDAWPRPHGANSRFLDPAVLARLGTMELKARTVVEGFLSGLHRSPFKGFSVEFAEYRQYLPGDDLAQLDWKVYARSDRHYVKKFEEETNLDCHLLLDVSASMAYRGAAPMSKFEYGSVLAASLAFLMNRQRDATGLMAFDHRIVARLPPGVAPRTPARAARGAGAAHPGEQSDLGRPLRQLASSVMKRGLVVLISDLLHDAEPVISGLRHLKARGCDVIVFQVLDPNELTFPFRGPSRFRDLESAAEVTADAAVHSRRLPARARRPDPALRPRAARPRHRLRAARHIAAARLRPARLPCGAKPPQVSGPDLPCRSCSRPS